MKPNLSDIDKAIASIPKPTCYADYTKTYQVLPGGEVVEIAPPKRVVCQNCNGSGWGPYDPWGRRNPCLNCNGEGQIVAHSLPKSEENAINTSI